MKIHSSTIQALALFTGKLKYTHIHFELNADKTIMVSANGPSILIVCQYEPNDSVCKFNIDPKVFPKTKDSYEITTSESSIDITAGPTFTHVSMNDGNFPYFRNVVPRAPGDTSEIRHYDPEQVMLFKKASKILGGSIYPIIRPNGIVDIGLPHVVGVIAPLNTGKADPTTHSIAPDWLK